MKTFQLTRPKDNAQAIAAAAKSKTAQQGAEIRFIAGGTTLVDLMKLSVETPAQLVDINRLPLDKIEKLPTGGLKIGATVRNSDLAFKVRTQHLLGANLLPDLQARLCPENSLTVSIVLQKMCAHKK